MTKKTARSRSTAKSSSTATATITRAMLKAGAKFGYRLIKEVTARNVSFVNTIGSKPSRNPAAGIRTVTISEFLELVN